MSSRLFQEIREKRGLVYSIQSFSANYTDTGIFGVGFGTGEKQIQESLNKAEKMIQDDWGLEVKHVDYSTPIYEAIDIYKKCLLAVGYHGSTIWLAKYLRAPMLIYSSKLQTSRSFPWATVQKKLETGEFAKLNPWQLRERSMKRLEELRMN